MQDAIPAATLILLRDVPGTAPVLPMVSRGAHLSFAANRVVFPGGRVDADDHALAARPDLLVEGPAIEADELAHRIAAIRETIEEIGLAPSVEGISDAAQIATLRAGLHAEEKLSLLLERLGLRIDPHAIHPFARWRPDHELARRFDTRFYLARAPEIGEAVADGTESLDCVWGTAQEHIARGRMIFPTLSNLQWIAQADGFDDAVERSRSYAPRIVTPWVEERDDGPWICIPEGIGYPVTTQPAKGIEREATRIKPSMT